MPSVIIPAHNESSVIGRCLQSFLPCLDREDFEVIVVCNGCNDDTADVVASVSNKIVCIETDKASKTHALNLGDEAAKFFPRIYQDADIQLSMETITAICETLTHGHLLAVSPQAKMDLSGSPWSVKAYYDIWLSLPYCQSGMIGAGVYALSEQGRERFDRFPEIIADDGYIRCLFQEHERGLTPGHYSVVNAPRTMAGLIKIKTRSRLGRYELEKKFPEIIAVEKKDYGNAIGSQLAKINRWPKLVVYLAVVYITKIRAKKQYQKGSITWERDDSSRKNSNIRRERRIS